MRKIIDCGLPQLKQQSFSWATAGAGILFTAHGPVKADGTIETGDIRHQATITFDNLQQALTAAKTSSDNVLQVMIYLTDRNDVNIVDDIYRRYFNPPYPNRSTVIVNGLVAPGMKIEITANAMMP